MRIFFLLLALSSTPALAQLHDFHQPPELSEPHDETAEGRHNQRVEEIVLEDAGSRIVERRVGGQTQRIMVEPKNTTGTSLPGYEVSVGDGARAQPGHLDGADSKRAPRVWNLHKF